jgi:hypothetical protein
MVSSGIAALNRTQVRGWKAKRLKLLNNFDLYSFSIRRVVFPPGVNYLFGRDRA